MRIRREAPMLVVLALTTMPLLSACGGETTPGPTGATTSPSRATVEPSPPASPATAPSYQPDTFADYFTDTFEPSMGSAERWEVIALGDSTTSGATIATPANAYPGVYAGMRAEEQGVRVVLHSYFPGGTVAEWNDRLAEDENLRAALREAEVVLVWIGFHDLLPALLDEACGTPDDWPGYGRCVGEMTRRMPADYEELFGAIESLVPGGSTILAGNFAMAPWIVEGWVGDPLYPKIKRVIQEEWIEAMAEAAVAHRGRVVDTYHEINGPNGDQLHPEFVASDGLHLSAEGQRFIAEVHLAQDGIEPAA